jgi:hypothetical protein
MGAGVAAEGSAADSGAGDAVAGLGRAERVRPLIAVSYCWRPHLRSAIWVAGGRPYMPHPNEMLHCSKLEKPTRGSTFFDVDVPFAAVRHAQ